MPAASPRAYKDFIGNLTTTTGKWAGKPFVLHDFQQELIDGIFRREWDPEDQRWKRVVREAVWGIGRKNGKTELIAAIALAALVVEREPGGLVVVAAATREQAGLLLQAAKRMVNQSKFGGRPLSDFIKVRRYDLYFEPLDATLKVISAEAQSQHGLNPNVAIIDEGHAAMEKDRELYDTLLTAQGAREDPLAIVITTAGPAPKGPMFDLYKYGKEVEAGTRVDPSFFFKWYEADPKQEMAVDDPEAWRQANPALGKFLPEEFFRKTAQAVKSGRMSEFMFRRLHMNNWTSAQERWLPSKLVDAAITLPVEIPEGAEITIGLDAAISRDRFAVVCVYNETLADGTQRAHVMSKAFKPEHEGAYINHEDVQTYILGLGARYSIREIVYDPAYLQLLVNGLAERGFQCTPFPQSAAKMTPATETFQRLMIEGQVALGDKNGELLEHIAACAVKPTETGVRLSKIKALMPTDLAIALAMALEAVYGGEQVGDDFALLC